MLKQKADNDKMLKTLREIVSAGTNRQCFDCGQKGVTYIDMTIGSFICTSCSGVLRGLTPPHRVKSISMATFTPDELEFIRSHGNDECAKTWLGLWDAKRTIKQEHRDFMVDKYERKRYYLEPASPLKSITAAAVPSIVHQQQPSITNTRSHQSDNLAVLKSIQLTPPAANNRQHRTHHLHQNGTTNGNGFSSDATNNNFFNQQTNHLNGSTNSHLNATITTNGVSSHNGSIKSDKFTSDGDFVADFSKASIYNSNNSLNSTGSGGKLVNGGGKVMPNGINGINGMPNGDVNANFANFADFENNKIYNAAEEYYKNNNNNSMASPAIANNQNNIQWNIWQQFQWPNQPEHNRWSLPMTTSSLSNNSLNSSGGTFNSNSSLNSTPSADRYAALKDLDEQLRDAKGTNDVVAVPTEPQAVPVNPFKNPFQHQQQPQNQPIVYQQQQSYQNWTNVNDSQSPFNGFGSPLNSNGFTNGFYYNRNMTNDIMQQPSPFGGKSGFGNPFMASGSASTNNPFL